MARAHILAGGLGSLSVSFCLGRAARGHMASFLSREAGPGIVSFGLLPSQAAMLSVLTQKGPDLFCFGIAQCCFYLISFF